MGNKVFQNLGKANCQNFTLVKKQQHSALPEDTIIHPHSSPSMVTIRYHKAAISRWTPDGSSHRELPRHCARHTA